MRRLHEHHVNADSGANETHELSRGIPSLGIFVNHATGIQHINDNATGAHTDQHFREVTHDAVVLAGTIRSQAGGVESLQLSHPRGWQQRRVITADSGRELIIGA